MGRIHNVYFFFFGTENTITCAELACQPDMLWWGDFPKL
jgi:hypothetical protein